MSEVRLITPITRQSTKKMQVAAYCRVSSNSADQLNSYAAQIRAYKKLIGERDDWELVDIFADEGLTGMKSETRDEFQRMIRMCELKQIDLIITKSISRFARNTKDALAYVRKLKLLGVGVQFEKEGISTLSMGDEMLLNTFSALAQEESQSISMNQRLSIVKRMELGEYVDSNAPYGYRLVDKMLAVYEPEAVIVRNIFTLYLQGFSTSEIARELNKLNIPTKSGKETWRPSRVAYILRNEKYIGDSFYQKTYRETTVPFNQHTNRGQEDRFYAKGTHPGIVDKNVFDTVQTLIEKRKENFSKVTTQNIYPLTSRIQCSECGSFYRRRIVSGTVKWVCSLHKDDSTACSSNYYSEERIYDGFISMVNKLRFSEDNILGQVISRLEMTLAAMKRNNTAARDLSKSIAELNAKLLMYEAAVSLKTARQRNTCEKENDAIDLLRDFVRCDNCGQPMKRRVSMKHRIRESWNCTNDDCGIRVRISDTQLLETITVLMNRVILNDHLLQPKPRKRYEPDAKVTKVGNDIALELERDAPNEEYIIEKTIEMAALMYEQSNAKLNLTVSLARKLAHAMATQDEFNRDYFTALASYITLGEQGRVVLHTKTETEVTLDDGSNESP